VFDFYALQVDWREGEQGGGGWEEGKDRGLAGGGGDGGVRGEGVGREGVRVEARRWRGGVAVEDDAGGCAEEDGRGVEEPARPRWRERWRASRRRGGAAATRREEPGEQRHSGDASGPGGGCVLRLKSGCLRLLSASPPTTTARDALQDVGEEHQHLHQ